MATPSEHSIQSQSWALSNRSAISGGFVNGDCTPGTQPSPSAGGCEAGDPALNQNSLTFYWVNPGDNGETVTYTYTLDNGQQASATATFNIGGPSGIGVGITPTGVIVLNPAKSTVQYRDVPLLINGGAGAPGMKFQATATTLASGTFQWVQLLNHDVSQFMGSNGPLPPSDEISGSPELDSTYPYGLMSNGSPIGTVTTTNLTNDTAQDSPFSALAVGQGEFSRHFDATMYLQWTPAPANGCSAGWRCTIPVPLGYIHWKWGGCAINTLQPRIDSNGVHYLLWVLSCGIPSNDGYRQGGPLTEWSAVVNPQ